MCLSYSEYPLYHHHNEISCVCFWTIIIKRAIEKLHISMMKDAMVGRFSFVGSIPEVMFRDVPVASKILEGYRKILVLGFRPLTPEMQSIIAEVDKPKKGGQKGSKKGEKKQSAKEGPSEPANTPKKRKAQDAPIKRKLNKAT